MFPEGFAFRFPASAKQGDIFPAMVLQERQLELPVFAVFTIAVFTMNANDFFGVEYYTIE